MMQPRGIKIGEALGNISDQIKIEHNAHRTQIAVFLKKSHPNMKVILDNTKIKGVFISNMPIITNIPRPPLNLRKQDQL